MEKVKKNESLEDAYNRRHGEEQDRLASKPPQRPLPDKFKNPHYQDTHDKAAYNKDAGNASDALTGARKPKSLAESLPVSSDVPIEVVLGANSSKRYAIRPDVEGYYATAFRGNHKEAVDASQKGMNTPLTPMNKDGFVGLKHNSTGKRLIKGEYRAEFISQQGGSVYESEIVFNNKGEVMDIIHVGPGSAKKKQELDRSVFKAFQAKTDSVADSEGMERTAWKLTGKAEYNANKNRNDEEARAQVEKENREREEKRAADAAEREREKDRVGLTALVQEKRALADQMLRLALEAERDYDTTDHKRLKIRDLDGSILIDMPNPDRKPPFKEVEKLAEIEQKRIERMKEAIPKLEDLVRRFKRRKKLEEEQLALFDDDDI